MFQTKRALREKIEQLERELSEAQAISAFINSSPLPKCESLACINCEHIMFQKHRRHLFVLGCGKNTRCPDFQKSDLSMEDRLSLGESLLFRQERERE